MQSTFEKKISKLIAHRNNNLYIRRKLFLTFSFLTVIGLVLGVAIFDALYRNKVFDTVWITEHFNKVFADCSTFTDFFSVILKRSEADIRTLIFVFITGFTYFCFPVAGAMTLAKGFITGFSVFYLISCKDFMSITFAGSNSIILPTIFITTRLTVCSITVYLAMSSYIFSYKFREVKSNRSILRRAPITYKFFYTFIYSVGGILLTNSCYCIILNNIIK